jgi:ribosomal subunit interface protein
VEVSVHDRTQALDPALREYSIHKLNALAEHFEPITSAEVEFDTDLKKRRLPVHVVKLTLHLTGHRLQDLRAHQTGSSLKETFDLALSKLGHELRSLREQVSEHDHLPLGDLPDPS